MISLGEVQNEVSLTQPYLAISEEPDGFVMRGIFLIAIDGELADEYRVEIIVSREFPENMPVIREIGGRIFRSAAHHVEDSGIACLLTPEEYHWKWKTKENFSLAMYLDGPVRHFFIGQSLVELGQPWPAGERGHGVGGLFEWYKEVLAITDDGAIIRSIEALRRHVKGHHSCPCGSMVPVRRCHSSILRIRNAIPPNVIQSTYDNYMRERTSAISAFKKLHLATRKRQLPFSPPIYVETDYRLWPSPQAILQF